MFLVILLHAALEVVVVLGVPLHLLLPHRPWEFFTHFHHDLHEVHTKLLAYELYYEQRHQVELHVDLIGHCHQPTIDSQGFVLHGNVVVVDLHHFFVDFWLEFQSLTNFGLVMDGLTVGEYGVVVL